MDRATSVKLSLIVAKLKGGELFWRRTMKSQEANLKAYILVSSNFMEEHVDDLDRVARELAELIPDE